MILFIFDIDGTLTENNNLSTKAFRKSVLNIFGISNYSENWAEYKNDSDTGIISELISSYQKRSVSKEELRLFQNYYLSCFESLVDTEEESISPIAGVNDFLDNIKKHEDIRIAIFTGCFPAIAERKLDMISVDKDLLLSAAFDGFSRESIFLECISLARKKYQIAHEKIVLFGDSYSDIKISQNIGVPFVGVTTHLSARTFIEAGAIATIHDYKKIDVEEVKNYVNS